MTEQNDNIKAEVEKLNQQLAESFLLKLDEAELLKPIDDIIGSCKSEFVEIFKTFRSNVESIISVAKLPVSMSFETSLQSMFQNVLRIEKLQSLKIPITDEEIKIKKEETEKGITPQKKANKLFNEKIKTPEGYNEFWYKTLNFLKSCSTNNPIDNQFLSSSKELINQSTLLSWSTLEVFIRDVFISVLNIDPKFLDKLYKHKDLKARFGIKSIPTEKLIEYNYDLTGKMGDLLIDSFDFSNINAIQMIYDCIFEKAELNLKLKDKEIWSLYNGRNLIIHRGGIIDQKYLSNTADSLAMGDKLYIKPDELKNYISKVVEIGIEVNSALNEI